MATSKRYRQPRYRAVTGGNSGGPNSAEPNYGVSWYLGLLSPRYEWNAKSFVERLSATNP